MVCYYTFNIKTTIFIDLYFMPCPSKFEKNLWAQASHARSRTPWAMLNPQPHLIQSQLQSHHCLLVHYASHWMLDKGGPDKSKEVQQLQVNFSSLSLWDCCTCLWLDIPYIVIIDGKICLIGKQQILYELNFITSSILSYQKSVLWISLYH